MLAYQKAKEKYYALYPHEPQPFITCTYRSGEEQNKLYNSKPKVTNAKAGQSPHNFNPSFAFDIGFIGEDKKIEGNIKLMEKLDKGGTEESDVKVRGGYSIKMRAETQCEIKHRKTDIAKKYRKNENKGKR